MVELKREMPKMVKQRRVCIPLDEDVFNHLHEVAFRNHTSISAIGGLALMRLLAAEAAGEFSLYPGYEGEPIPRA